MNTPDLDAPPPRYSGEPAPEVVQLPTVDDARRTGALETSPAWELELLISAAIVVGLFALPGIIERIFARIEPHATAAAQSPIGMLHIYLLSAGYALLVAFTIHFCARAYWVGLLGLNSVFPRGLRWDRMHTGPAVTEVYRKRLREPRRVIERVDNFCSITFSFAFMIVMVLVFTIVMMGVSGAVAWGIAHAFTGGKHLTDIFEVVIVAYLAFTMGTVLVDKRFGQRMKPDGAARRWFRRAATVVFYTTPTALTGPILLTLTSNIGRRKMMLTFQCAVIAVLLLAGVDRLARAGKLRVNSYEYFASNSSHSVDYKHYADARPAGERYTHVPTIQSEVVSGPYLELFIPYTPSVDNEAVAARCPSLAPLTRNGVTLGSVPFVSDASVTAALQCLATLHPVTLDGAPVQASYDFYQDPASGLQGMLAHIPATPLAPGRHLLTVAASPVTSDSAASLAGRDFIPFWR